MRYTLFLMIFILICSCSNSDCWKEYEENGRKHVGKFKNGKKIGRHFFLSESDPNSIDAVYYDKNGNDSITIQLSGTNKILNY
ncbi:MAG: hypothetical protein SNJ77_01940 [Cytophagales bacterium]